MAKTHSAQKHDHERSPEWRDKREAWVQDHPDCALCGGTIRITVHHRFPFHLYPDFELLAYIPWDKYKELFQSLDIPRPANGLVQNYWTLCEGKHTLNCHLIFGHFDNFEEKYNPHIDVDVALWSKRLAAHNEQAAL